LLKPHNPKRAYATKEKAPKRANASGPGMVLGGYQTTYAHNVLCEDSEF